MSMYRAHYRAFPFRRKYGLCELHKCGSRWQSERDSELLDLVLQMIVSLYVGAREPRPLFKSRVLPLFQSLDLLWAFTQSANASLDGWRTNAEKQKMFCLRSQTCQRGQVPNHNLHCVGFFRIHFLSFIHVFLGPPRVVSKEVRKKKRRKMLWYYRIQTPQKCF